MINTTQYERTEEFSTSCKSCGRRLLNPGYSRNSVYCCGKYRTWYTTTDVVVEITTDDGRDSMGRFHHRPTVTRREVSRIVSREGGI